jgi:hypothetical protein
LIELKNTRIQQAFDAQLGPARRDVARDENRILRKAFGKIARFSRGLVVGFPVRAAHDSENEPFKPAKPTRPRNRRASSRGIALPKRFPFVSKPS